MTTWVAQKGSLYGLVATGICQQRLRAEGDMILITQATWQDIERELEYIHKVVAHDILMLREQRFLEVIDSPTEKKLSLYKQFDGRISLQMCTLLALVDANQGTLLTDCAVTIRTIHEAGSYSYETGVGLARRWLTDTPNEQTQFVKRAAQLVVLTPGHPEAAWWYSKLGDGGATITDE